MFVPGLAGGTFLGSVLLDCACAQASIPNRAAAIVRTTVPRKRRRLRLISRDIHVSPIGRQVPHEPEPAGSATGPARGTLKGRHGSVSLWERDTPSARRRRATPQFFLLWPRAAGMPSRGVFRTDDATRMRLAVRASFVLPALALHAQEARPTNAFASFDQEVARSRQRGRRATLAALGAGRAPTAKPVEDHVVVLECESRRNPLLELRRHPAISKTPSDTRHRKWW